MNFRFYGSKSAIRAPKCVSETVLRCADVFRSLRHHHPLTHHSSLDQTSSSIHSLIHSLTHSPTTHPVTRRYQGAMADDCTVSAFHLCVLPLRISSLHLNNRVGIADIFLYDSTECLVLSDSLLLPHVQTIPVSHYMLRSFSIHIYPLTC